MQRKRACAQPDLAALGRLHSQSLDTLPPDGPRNWYFDHRATQLLREAKKLQPHALQHAVIQLEAGLESFFARTPHPIVAILDDLHPCNSLASGDDVVLIDWNNLRRGDAAIDLGYLGIMLDWSMLQMTGVVTEYAPKAGIDSASDAAGFNSLQARTQAYTAYCRLRGFTFFDQWSGTKPLSSYLRQRMAEDVESLDAPVLRGLNFRPHALLRDGAA